MARSCRNEDETRSNEFCTSLRFTFDSWTLPLARSQMGGAFGVGVVKGGVAFVRRVFVVEVIVVCEWGERGRNESSVAMPLIKSYVLRN